MIPRVGSFFVFTRSKWFITQVKFFLTLIVYKSYGMADCVTITSWEALGDTWIWTRISVVIAKNVSLYVIRLWDHVDFFLWIVVQYFAWVLDTMTGAENRQTSFAGIIDVATTVESIKNIEKILSKGDRNQVCKKAQDKKLRRASIF